MTTTPTATPPLLKTYQEARLLWEAKNWKLTGVADELGEKPELKRFHITHTKLSKKTTSESPSPIEPEVAAAVEALETRPGYERQVEIVTRGLLALHGAAPAPVEDGGTQGENGAAPGEDVANVLKELRDALPGELVEALEEKAGARETKLIDALEEKAGARDGKLLQAVAKLGRLIWKHVAISAGVGAVAAGVMAPVLARSITPPPPPPAPAVSQFVVLPPGGVHASPVQFEPETLLALSEWGEKKPLDQQVPPFTLPGQKVAPCDARVGMKEINGNCWFASADLKPPCGALFRHGDKCYAPVSAKPWPAEPGPDR